MDAIERERTEKMPHLKAVYFLRPTAENVRLLQKEFKEPKYGEYHVFFSNLTRDGHIQALAESDEHEVVQQVQEYYADFLAIHQEIFTLNITLPELFVELLARLSVWYPDLPLTCVVPVEINFHSRLVYRTLAPLAIQAFLFIAATVAARLGRHDAAATATEWNFVVMFLIYPILHIIIIVCIIVSLHGVGLSYIGMITYR